MSIFKIIMIKSISYILSVFIISTTALAVFFPFIGGWVFIYLIDPSWFPSASWEGFWEHPFLELLFILSLPFYITLILEFSSTFYVLIFYYNVVLLAYNWRTYKIYESRYFCGVVHEATLHEYLDHVWLNVYFGHHLTLGLEEYLPFFDWYSFLAMQLF